MTPDSITTGLIVVNEGNNEWGLGKVVYVDPVYVSVYFKNLPGTPKDAIKKAETPVRRWVTKHDGSLLGAQAYAGSLRLPAFRFRTRFVVLHAGYPHDLVLDDVAGNEVGRCGAREDRSETLPRGQERDVVKIAKADGIALLNSPA